MEERISDPLAGASFNRSVGGMMANANRRTPAIDILTSALMSPSHLSPSRNEENLSDQNSEGERTTSTVKSSAAAAAAARSFLDQMSSVYVIDADTGSGTHSIIPNISGGSTISSRIQTQGNIKMPKIFGCWNFLHQAMNEIERCEEEKQQLYLLHQTQSLPNSGLDSFHTKKLVSETRLLAEFAVKVARRSDDIDRQKVATCVENFFMSRTSSTSPSNNVTSANSTSSKRVRSDEEVPEHDARRGELSSREKLGGNNIGMLLPELVRANAEIREIVTGRIAAFSFNNSSVNVTKPSIGSHPSSLTQSLNSALEDPVVVETFCKFLAANAVSNGPERLRRFLNDWIIPGAAAEVGVSTTGTSTNSYNLKSAIQENHDNKINNENNSNVKRQRISPNSKRSLHHRLPPFSLACVLYHVAAESVTTTEAAGLPLTSSTEHSNSTANFRSLSPHGTIDTLQRLSMTVMANVLLGPVLHDGLNRKRLKRQTTQHHSSFIEDDDDRIIAMGLNAITTWCATTGLSLAQTKHVGTKVRINLSHLLSESLNTDSPRVMCALADLIEDVVERHVVPCHETQSCSHHPLISKDRMTQTRYLMQVPDEESFRANVSEEQLHTIETKELSDILREFSVDLEKQRFRFPSFGGTAITEEQKAQHGEVQLDDRSHSLALSIARIVAATCMGFAKMIQSDLSTRISDAIETTYHIPGTGLLELLSKCASHPSVSVCAIALPVVTPMLRSEVGLATEWLPTLQRRAIIPHHPKSRSLLPSSKNDGFNSDDAENRPLLNAADICFVEFEEFMGSFRDTVLADALKACFETHSEYYLASCTAAIEEFCTGDIATEQTSFHLEAALFCLVAISEQVMSGAEEDSTSPLFPSPNRKKTFANPSNYLVRCTAALAKRPKSLVNPLTMAQACRFFRKYAKWISSNLHQGVLDIATDISLFILSQCATSFPDSEISSTIQAETGVTPYSEATKTLRCLLSSNPNHFLSNKAIAAMGAGWESTFAACNRPGKLLTIEDRKNACVGICHVLAALPEDQQQTSLMALALASIACLETMLERADSCTAEDDLSQCLNRAAHEIIILATIAQAFSDATSNLKHGPANRSLILEPVLSVLNRAWPSISIAASQHSSHDSILSSLGFLFIQCTSVMTNNRETSVVFMNKVASLAKSLLENEKAQQNVNFFSPVLKFVCGSVQAHAEAFQVIAQVALNNGEHAYQRDSSVSRNYSEHNERTYYCVHSLVREAIAIMGSQRILGNAWILTEKQGNGQSAFESKTKVEYSSADFSTDGLGPLFSLLEKSAKLCPTFFFHVMECFQDENENRQHSRILQSVLKSAVLSIIYSEVDLSLEAIRFLESVVLLARPSAGTDANHKNNKLTEAYADMTEENMLSTLLRGFCGVFQPSVIPAACRLFFLALISFDSPAEKFQLLFSRGLCEDNFYLGERAWKVIHKFCYMKYTESTTADRSDTDNKIAKRNFEDMERLMTEIWQLHRHENADAIEASGLVQSFCNTYSGQFNKGRS